jgi:aminomethyltransferase
MALRTPLFDWHVARGGRMVEFGGWDMPVQYTGIVEEHNAVRTGAGLFDVSHMGRLSIGGRDPLAFIQGVVTCDVASMKDFQARYGLVCNASGGIRDDVLVYRWPYGWSMVVNASNREKIVAWFGEQNRAGTAEIADRTTATCMIAVQGPKAVEACRGLTDADAGELAYYHAAATRCTAPGFTAQQCVVSRTGYTGEDGLEFMIGADYGVALCDELVRRGVVPCGLGARDTLRLEAAMPLYGHELAEDVDPLQAGLARSVKFDKGDFIGRDALLRRREDKSSPVRVGLELVGKRIAREGCGVLQGDRPVGRVTSGTFSPTLQKAIAMAYVEPACAAVGTALNVDVRGKPESARVVALPFYRRPKAAAGTTGRPVTA